MHHSFPTTLPPSKALATTLDLTPAQVEIADFAAGSVVVQVKLNGIPDSSAAAAVASKVEVVDSLGPVFGTGAVSDVEQAGAQGGSGGGVFSSMNPGQYIELALNKGQGSSDNVGG